MSSQSFGPGLHDSVNAISSRVQEPLEELIVMIQATYLGNKSIETGKLLYSISFLLEISTDLLLDSLPCVEIHLERPRLGES